MTNKNIVWQKTTITQEDREKLLNQKGIVLWFTGLSGSGKSTLANRVIEILHNKNKATYLLDGDNIRHGLNSDLGFSNEDRKENIRRIGEVAKLFCDAGLITVASFISPFNSDRNTIRNKLTAGTFIEIFVDCSLDTCEKRDVKGLYKKARTKEILEFSGISSPYEKPQDPEIIVKTDKYTIESCSQKIISYLKELKIV